MAAVGLGLAISVATADAASAAAYQVNVYDAANAPGGAAAYCGYNHSSVGGSCQLFVNGVGTASPLGGNGAATAASATGYVQAQSTASYLVDPSIHVQDSASADLASATIHVQSYDTSANNGYQGGASTSAVADLYDTLHFAIAGAGATTVTPVTFTLTINGAMGPTGTAQDANSAGEFSGAFIFGPAADQSSASFDFQNNSTTGFATTAYLGGSNTTGWTTSAGGTVFTYTETYDLTGASGDLPLSLTDHLNCSDGESCNYSATIGLSGPAAFSYSSASGVFLAPSGGVPEPGVWTMLLLGLGGAGAALRRARRGQRLAGFAL